MSEKEAREVLNRLYDANLLNDWAEEEHMDSDGEWKDEIIAIVREGR